MSPVQVFPGCAHLEGQCSSVHLEWTDELGAGGGRQSWYLTCHGDQQDSGSTACEQGLRWIHEPETWCSVTWLCRLLRRTDDGVRRGL